MTTVAVACLAAGSSVLYGGLLTTIFIAVKNK